MMTIKRTWTCKGLPITSTWITDSSYERYRPFTQVYGVCFTKDDKVLVVKDLEDWIIPGGTPEPGELPEQTLRREIEEEAAVITGLAKMIGCVHNSFPNNPVKSEGESFYQLRYVAVIDRIDALRPDPCTGRTFQREFIKPEQFNNYVKWGDVGKEMFRLAYEKFQNWKRTGQF